MLNCYRVQQNEKQNKASNHFKNPFFTILEPNIFWPQSIQRPRVHGFVLEEQNFVFRFSKQFHHCIGNQNHMFGSFYQWDFQDPKLEVR